MEKEYVGSELALFQHAITWKGYFSGHLKPYIKGDVLEVGAGAGGTTAILMNEKVSSWICLEPDAALSAAISKKINTGVLPSKCRLITGTIENVNAQFKFSTIVYIDVIEHIEDDKAELRRAYEKLLPGGRLIVLVPAFQMMFSEFDKAIGHYRRYSKSHLKAAAPKDMQLERMFYLDTVGLAASLVNKLALKQAYPTRRQISFWDNVLVPFSKVTDKLLLHSFGKSLIGIWKHP